MARERRQPKMKPWKREYFGEDKQRQYQRHQGSPRRMQLSWFN